MLSKPGRARPVTRPGQTKSVNKYSIKERLFEMLSGPGRARLTNKAGQSCGGKITAYLKPDTRGRSLLTAPSPRTFKCGGGGPLPCWL